MAPLPNNPAEQAAARMLAQEARKARAVVKAKLKSGELALADVLEQGKRGATDELGDHARIVGRIMADDLIGAAHGVGKAGRKRIVGYADVAGKRVDQLTIKNRQAIMAAYYDRTLGA